MLIFLTIADQSTLHHNISLMEVMFFMVPAKLTFWRQAFTRASFKLSHLKHRPSYLPNILLGRLFFLTLSHLVWMLWSSPLSIWSPKGNKSSYCVQTDNTQNDEASGPDTVEPTATQATQAPVLSSQIMPGPSIADFWLEVRTEGFIEQRDGGRKRGTRQGQGDGRSLGFEQLPISQLPLLNTRITEEAGTEICVVFSLHHQPFFTFLSFSCPCYYYLLICFAFYPRVQSLFLSISLDFPAFDAPLLCFSSLLSISIALPPVCGQRAGESM